MADTLAKIGRGRGTRRAAGLLSLAGLATLIIAVGMALRHDSAEAIAPCASHTNNSEEMTFLAGLQSWRDSHIAGSFPLTLSAPLNAAAAGYAKYLVEHPGSGGHYADGGAGGRAWADRAIQCGYPSSEAAGGEGLAVFQSSVTLNTTPQQALGVMTAENGGGVWVPSSVGPSVKCVGVAKISAANGHEDAWVTLLFGTWDGVCPQAVTGGPPAPSLSPSATNTPTATPTKTPTPTPTPSANYNGQVRLNSGWNLVTLPVGPLADILDTARGCFSAVYQAEGDHWRRYVPDAPAYASNLAISTGGAFWVLGTEANCGLIRI